MGCIGHHRGRAEGRLPRQRGRLLSSPLEWADDTGRWLINLEVNLADSKAVPRKVFLNTPARAVIERQPRTVSPFVFPSPRDPERACSPNLPLWYPARRQAGIEDVCLHDPRHAFAKPRSASGHSAAGVVPPARPQAVEHDAALCPCR